MAKNEQPALTWQRELIDDSDPAWDPRYRQLNMWQRESARRAVTVVQRHGSEIGVAVCGVTRTHDGTPCERPAGSRTDHEGEGACRRHDSMASRRSEVAWLMAHRFAQELDCTPWDGLLKAVRIAAGKVAYCEWVLSLASDDLQIEGRRPRELTEDRELADESGNVKMTKVGTGVFVHPDTGEPLGHGSEALRDMTFWVSKSELWTDRLARYSKAAVDAGVAERLVQQVELQAHAIARPLTAIIETIMEDDTLDDDARDRLAARVRQKAREELLALESDQHVTIQGQITADAPWSAAEW